MWDGGIFQVKVCHHHNTVVLKYSRRHLHVLELYNTGHRKAAELVTNHAFDLVNLSTSHLNI